MYSGGVGLRVKVNVRACSCVCVCISFVACMRSAHVCVLCLLWCYVSARGESLRLAAESGCARVLAYSLFEMAGQQRAEFLQ